MNDKLSFAEPVKEDGPGTYRWTAEVNLLKDWGIFFLIWRILFFCFLGIFLVTSLSDLAQWGVGKFLENLPILLYVLVGMTALTLIGYLIYAAIMGGKYIVDFTMDEKGINHSQTAAQAKKARKIGAATMTAGAASGSFSAIGAGMNAQRTELYSEFSKVRKVKCFPRKNLIKLSAPFNHNQVYTLPGDFEFVKSYILSHCGNLK